jgi:mono/diheme cytochrome c family protein
MSRRRPLTILAVVGAAAAITACGSKSIDLGKTAAHASQAAALKQGAEIFAQRCGGCHTLDAAGTQGSATSVKYRERTDGPNLNTRKEQMAQVLYAIANGGFSGAIMPQNIVVGPDAQKVAAFVAKYAGRKAKTPKGPSGPPPAGF